MLPYKIKIALVDDHPIVVEGLEKTLSNIENIEITGRFANGKDLLAFLEHTPPDVILQDITLPDISGVELCKTIKLRFPQIIVLALSHHHNRKIIMDMLNNGANGYLLKNTSLKELVACINAAVQGEIIFSQDVK